MKFAGVVVLYNPSDNVKENIESYLPNLNKLYVVDNSINKDNTNKLPKSKKIEYINNHKNLGIAKALNIACQKALDEGFDWILTMDQDSKFKGENLDKLMEYVKNIKEEQIGIVTPYHLIETQVPRSKLQVEHPIEVMTSGNLLNLKAYNKVGGFKDWLFIDCVDIELCMNLRVHNYDIIRLNYLELEQHLVDSKFHLILWKKVVSSNHNYIRRYYIARNCYYIHKMYHEYFPEYCNFIKNGIKYQVRNILVLEKDKFRKIRSIIRGIKDFKNGVKGEYPYEK